AGGGWRCVVPWGWTPLPQAFARPVQTPPKANGGTDRPSEPSARAPVRRFLNPSNAFGLPPRRCLTPHSPPWPPSAEPGYPAAFPESLAGPIVRLAPHESPPRIALNRRASADRRSL